MEVTVEIWNLYMYNLLSTRASYLKTTKTQVVASVRQFYCRIVYILDTRCFPSPFLLGNVS